jgi:hypothetical protein
MRRFLVCSVIGMAVSLVGCQEQKTTTSGPGGVNPRTGQAEPKKLTMNTAKEQTIKRGDTDNVKVTVRRENFDDPVRVHIDNLPKGVEVLNAEDAVIPGGADSTTLTLKADPATPVGDHPVQISADAPGLDMNTQTMTLHVKE